MLLVHALPTAPTLSHPTFAADAHRAPANVSRGHALHLTNASILFPGDEHPVSARELVLLVERRGPQPSVALALPASLFHRLRPYAKRGLLK